MRFSDPQVLSQLALIRSHLGLLKPRLDELQLSLHNADKAEMQSLFECLREADETIDRWERRLRLRVDSDQD